MKRTRVGRLWLVALAVLLLAGSGVRSGGEVAAQDLPPVVGSAVLEHASPTSDSTRGLPDATPAVLGALVGGAVGAVLGSYAGFYLTGGGRICGDDPCGMLGGIYGFLLGEFVGIGLGAHLGNGGRGQAGAAIAASFAGLLVAGMLGSVVEAGDAWIVLVPAAQITAAVAAELGSSR